MLNLKNHKNGTATVINDMLGEKCKLPQWIDGVEEVLPLMRKTDKVTLTKTFGKKGETSLRGTSKATDVLGDEAADRWADSMGKGKSKGKGDKSESLAADIVGARNAVPVS